MVRVFVWGLWEEGLVAREWRHCRYRTRMRGGFAEDSILSRWCYLRATRSVPIVFCGSCGR